MTETTNFRFVRLVKTILDIVYGTLIFSCVGLLVWIVLSPMLVKTTGILGTASVPVRISNGGNRQITVSMHNTADEKIQASFVDEVGGTLRLETSSLLFIFIANAAKFLVGIGLIYVLYLLRKLVENVLDAQPFSPQNAQRMRSLGWTVLFVGLLQPLIEYIAASEILNQLPSTTPVLKPGTKFNPAIILVSLLILLLAYIWTYGRELELDRALTV